MKRKFQLVLTEDAGLALDRVMREATEDFKCGTISLSDAVNEMILTSRVDIKILQTKHTNIRKSLRIMAAQKDIDIDAAIKSLTEMKARGVKRPQKSTTPITEVAE